GVPPHRGRHRLGGHAQHPAPAAGAHGSGVHTFAARVLPRVRGDRGAPRACPQRAAHHAPRPDEPRRGDRLARRRRSAQRNPRPGDQRRRGTNGRSLSARRWETRARRRRQARRPRLMGPLLLRGGRVIDPSRGFDQTADVLIQDGKVAAVGPGLGTPEGVEVRDVADHCEDPTLAAGGAMHEGLVATRLGLKGIPAAAEEIMVARDIVLAELTGGRVHLCHLSTRGSVDLVRRAKERGLRVTAEATPHHFTLTDHACEDYDTHAKMNPPLREAADVAALRAALKDGAIDCIASDHAPHSYDEKEAAFDEAPFGIVGLETALGVAYTELVQGGVLTLPELLGRMSTEPARIFGLQAGTLTPGVPGDVCVLDVHGAWTVEPARFHCKSRNTPFAG